MITNSLPPKPTDDQLALAGEKFGQMLVENTQPVERRYIREYGQNLIADEPAGFGLTARFLRELTDLASKMEGYSVQAARMSTCADLIADLQCRIALYVARTDTELGVS